jgi:hypothetical protein
MPEQVKNMLLESILASEYSVFLVDKSNTFLGSLSALLHPFFRPSKNYQYVHTTYYEYLNKRFQINPKQKSLFAVDTVDDLFDKKAQMFSLKITKILNRNFSEFQSNIAIWDSIVSLVNSTYKSNWATKVLSVSCAGIKTENRLDEFLNIGNNSLSEVKRSRAARLKSGNVSYWTEQFKTNDEILFKLLIHFTWATPRTILKLTNTLNRLINRLPKKDYKRLRSSLENTSRYSTFSSNNLQQLYKDLDSTLSSNKFIFLLSARVASEDRAKFIFSNTINQNENDPELADSYLEYYYKMFSNFPSNKTYLKELKKAYSKAGNYSVFGLTHRKGFGKKIPKTTAEIILESNIEYPREIVHGAQFSIERNIFSSVQPVGKIAYKQKWFEFQAATFY